MPAIRKALKAAGLTMDDIDLVELNEAFAAQVLACLAELPIDPDKLNVNGGAIALGHPLGCTGAKLTTSLLYEMRRRGARYGLVTMCVGGGMGAAGIFERSELRVTSYGLRGRVRSEGDGLRVSGATHDDSDCDTRRHLADRADGTGGAFTPERMTDDHRLIAQTTEEFATGEVMPAVERLEQKDWDLARALLRRCGELGLLGVNVPEAYGGVELDKVSSLVVSEHIARSASFGATYGAQANLCILPILMFGTDDQKQRYLPKLVSGEMVGAYALSESGSGSDALGARAKATRLPDGSFTLSGEKMWITNGGFADIVIVFAKVDGEHFSAFIVERAFGGVSSGKEEHKMGLHGSSTTPVILQEVPVPAANLLGESARATRWRSTCSTSGA